MRRAAFNDRREGFLRKRIVDVNRGSISTVSFSP
jgi:hypothetical protein